ncbi:MAG: ABC transporter substrate-binding protein [Deltaproteobacteria bacterium]|uniref:ABC transporter substrate-binding protein n=1 Tax=Desulfobacula sp. TaxID=2593537 RepID=UPI0019A39743|nr:ABC transporter substrate-binding protein [Candidatus Desulfobacula maris]MBL6993950.1 ABC transporter substrate-binding protein [Desulfobacula sp.]
MKRSIKPIAIGILCLLAVFQMDVCAQESYETKPITNNGKKWRIGYLEGGPYANYQSILKSVTASLMDSGWLQRAPIPECQDESETRTLWNFLSTKIQSDYLEFPSDAYWTFEWKDAEREKLKQDTIKRLKNNKDIDLMLAFGTWAGQDLANDQHNTPTIVLSASNAIQSGIIKSVEDSGFDHLHAWIDPNKTERQLRLFHEITGFKRLGLAYENSSNGRSYASLEDIMKLSLELGFQVIECHLPIDHGSGNEGTELIKCHEQLAPKIDAIYITDYAGLSEKSITKLLSPLFKYKVPMFVQTRYDLVKNGILMGAARSEFKADAKFYVQTFAKILNGAKPGDLPQKFESPLKIAINLESAKKIGFRFPLDILAGAFEMHETIEKPENEK